MKKFRIDYLLAASLMLAGGMAAVSTTGAPKNKVLTQTWVRTGTPAQPNRDNSWEIGSLSESCNAAEKLCKGVFEDGYNPNAHTDSENTAANQSGSIQTGYVPE